MSATCKTCGATLPGKHSPSPLDRHGIGDPGHKMTSPDKPKEMTELERVTKILGGLIDSVEALSQRVKQLEQHVHLTDGPASTSER